MQHNPETNPTVSLKCKSPIPPASDFASKKGSEVGGKKKRINIYIDVEREQQGGQRHGRLGLGLPGRGSARRSPRRRRRGGGAPQGAATSCPGEPSPATASSSSSLPSLLLRPFRDWKKLKSSSPPSPPLLRRRAAGERPEPCQSRPMAARPAPPAAPPLRVLRREGTRRPRSGCGPGGPGGGFTPSGEEMLLRPRLHRQRASFLPGVCVRACVRACAERRRGEGCLPPSRSRRFLPASLPRSHAAAAAELAAAQHGGRGGRGAAAERRRSAGSRARAPPLLMGLRGGGMRGGGCWSGECRDTGGPRQREEGREEAPVARVGRSSARGSAAAEGSAASARFPGRCGPGSTGIAAVLTAHRRGPGRSCSSGASPRWKMAVVGVQGDEWPLLRSGRCGIALGLKYHQHIDSQVKLTLPQKARETGERWPGGHVPCSHGLLGRGRIWCFLKTHKFPNLLELRGRKQLRHVYS